jgi:LCP family protein required for cell wall assembly
MTKSRIIDKQKRRKQTTFRRFVRISLLVFTFLIIIVGGTLAYLGNQLNNATSSAQQELIRGDHSNIREKSVSPNKDNISILFLGVDDRGGDLSGRTDANLLATFNEKEGSVKILSIPRDSLVEIPGRGNDKINHAHAFGGVDLTIDTIEHLLDVPVDYFLTINFNAFMEIIDSLGGVEVEVPFTFSEMNSTDRSGAITLEEGNQTLNGEEALAFVRMRKSDPRGDIGRGDRQKELLEATLRKGASFSSITRFGDVMNSLESHMKTNLSFTDILSMHGYATNLDEIEQVTIDGKDTSKNGIYYYDLEDEDISQVSEELRLHLGLTN